MSKPSHVPKFGNWDANDHLPFTVVFERARADKNTGNKIINPNDPSENPAAFGLKTDSPSPSSRRSSHQYADEFGIKADSARGRPNASGGPQKPTMADHSKRGLNGGARDSEGVDSGEAYNQSAEQSSSYPAFKARLGNRPVSSSHGPEKKGRPEGGTSVYPARSRLRPGSRGEETPERSSIALPKFGAWNEKEPNSGEGFTVVFSQARKEKKLGGPTHIPSLQSESPTKVEFGDAYKPSQFPIHRKASSWACCFHAREAG
eukprot:c13422_g1_i1 orf=264-1046(+)